MFHAAHHTHQVAAAAIDDVNKGMVAKCQQTEKAIYYAKFALSKHQQCGPYKIELHAVAAGGAESVLVNYLDVLCVYYMKVDFKNVDWGTITPGKKDIVSGDLLFNPPSDSAPTVKNVGNSGMGVGVHFTDMVQQNVPSPKTITTFDACFGRSPATIQCIDPINSSQYAKFDDNRDRVLCSNEVGKLDLSVHPPETLPQGTYKGTVDIIARSVKICPTDKGP